MEYEFEVGKTYVHIGTFNIPDFKYTVVKRTAKTVILHDNTLDEDVRRKIRVRNEMEYVEVNAEETLLSSSIMN